MEINPSFGRYHQVCKSEGPKTTAIFFSSNDLKCIQTHCCSTACVFSSWRVWTNNQQQEGIKQMKRCLCFVFMGASCPFMQMGGVRGGSRRGEPSAMNRLVLKLESGALKIWGLSLAIAVISDWLFLTSSTADSENMYVCVGGGGGMRVHAFVCGFDLIFHLSLSTVLLIPHACFLLNCLPGFIFIEEKINTTIFDFLVYL